MTITLKYVILYVISGGVTGALSEGNKNIAIVCTVIAALFGSKVGLEYAILSALEFYVGFFIGDKIRKGGA